MRYLGFIFLAITSNLFICSVAHIEDVFALAKRAQENKVSFLELSEVYTNSGISAKSVVQIESGSDKEISAIQLLKEKKSPKIIREILAATYASVSSKTDYKTYVQRKQLVEGMLTFAIPEKTSKSVIKRIELTQLSISKLQYIKKFISKHNLDIPNLTTLTTISSIDIEKLKKIEGIIPDYSVYPGYRPRLQLDVGNLMKLAKFRKEKLEVVAKLLSRKTACSSKSLKWFQIHELLKIKEQRLKDIENSLSLLKLEYIGDLAHNSAEFTLKIANIEQKTLNRISKLVIELDITEYFNTINLFYLANHLKELEELEKTDKTFLLKIKEEASVVRCYSNLAKRRDEIYLSYIYYLTKLAQMNSYKLIEIIEFRKYLRGGLTIENIQELVDIDFRNLKLLSDLITTYSKQKYPIFTYYRLNILPLAKLDYEKLIIIKKIVEKAVASMNPPYQWFVFNLPWSGPGSQLEKLSEIDVETLAEIEKRIDYGPDYGPNRVFSIAGIEKFISYISNQ